eukprot:TRINITY_DN2833_c0_g1_i2.p1 TRINITY_DN2833_c0_g1~~TRINITY_DN2833_c0_g1_i2.p1  ORF type:complete len:499 (+),score=83.78 TRINITY_DN2833_c0_g1_i2:61-1497(+)
MANMVLKLSVAVVLLCTFTVILESGRLMTSRVAMGGEKKQTAPEDINDMTLDNLRREVRREMEVEKQKKPSLHTKLKTTESTTPATTTTLPTTTKKMSYTVFRAMKTNNYNITFTSQILQDMKGGTCSEPPKTFERVLNSHKKKRPFEYTPIELLTKLQELQASSPNSIAVAFIPGSEIPATKNEIPILNTHNGKYTITKHWGDKSLWKDLRWNREDGTPSFMPQQPPMWGAVIKNAWVYQGNVYSCEHAFTTGACLWEIALKRRETYASFEKVFAICDSWCKGFFHFTHEHLPRLAPMYSILQSDPSIKITAPPNRGFVTSFLTDVLLIDSSRIISNGAAVHAEIAYYPQPQTCGNIWTHTLHLLRDIVFSLHGLRHAVEKREVVGGEPFRVVLAERAGGKSGKSRMPTNYEDVKTSLAEHYGGKVVFESSLEKNALEQVKLFNKADMAIGPHGANLANLMWMRQGAAVVEFMSYRF